MAPYVGRAARTADFMLMTTEQFLRLLTVPIGGGVLVPGALWLDQRSH